MSTSAVENPALETARQELHSAMTATKCHRCGCFQDTVLALAGSSVLPAILASQLAEARALFEPMRYDCLGCEVCWPALATNAAAELDPALAQTGHCATEDAPEREGWPPLPGDYRVMRFRAPVAVCTLNSDDLVPRLTAARPSGLAIVGSLHTENLGIEHLIRNLLPDPHVRFLVVCGEDTRKAIGHLPGQSLVSLIREGVDESGRIRGAQGKRPILKNVSRAQVETFRRRLQAVDLIGTTDLETIAGRIAEAAASDPGPVNEITAEAPVVSVQRAVEPARLVSDPAGYLVIYPDRRRHLLMLEHYANNGVLTRVIEGATPTALYGTVIAEGLISRLDHAAYLGRELARAQHALATGEDYVQDCAPGEEEIAATAPGASCGCMASAAGAA
ncbi:MAG: tetrahydromethanopterin S-methyltransferase subunit A [Betaproteobacteria bacterium]|nr:tetrahydromethanopterin S-methyltransferase subunit A [Betaproteobacteria bacterium]